MKAKEKLKWDIKKRAKEQEGKWKSRQDREKCYFKKSVLSCQDREVNRPWRNVGELKSHKETNLLPVHKHPLVGRVTERHGNKGKEERITKCWEKQTDSLWKVSDCINLTLALAAMFRTYSVSFRVLKLLYKEFGRSLQTFRRKISSASSQWKNKPREKLTINIFNDHWRKMFIMNKLE
jgi:hypothetical protein